MLATIRPAAPRAVRYSASKDVSNKSSGTVSWDRVGGPRIAGYVVYMFPSGIAFNADGDSLPGFFHDNGAPIFNEIGRATGTSFELPEYDMPSAMFGVRSITSDGHLSNMRYLSMTESTLLPSVLNAKLLLNNFGEVIASSAGNLLEHS